MDHYAVLLVAYIGTLYHIAGKAGKAGPSIAPPSADGAPVAATSAS